MKHNPNTPSEFDNIEGKLWKYIDGYSTPEEMAKIELLLKQRNEWKQKYNELLQLHKLIQSSELEQPSMRFTKNIMEQIAMIQIAPATKNYIDKKVIWSIASFFIITIIGFIIYAISQVDWSAGNNNTVAGVDLSEVDYTSVFNNTFVNIFMMINVVLGLMFLETYLSGKNNETRTKKLIS